MTREEIEIHLGLSRHFRRPAAEAYYEAFRQKLEPIIGSSQHGVAILEKDFDADRAFVALYKSEFAGIAGLHHEGRHFANFRVSTFIHEFGYLRGAAKYGLMRFAARPLRPGELLMNGIVVRSSLRGRGIGTLLLHAIVDFARINNYGSVRLDVVATNPGARRLYERLGFVATKTRQYPYLRRLFGFSAVITMKKDVT